ncbi:hypothetical protein [Micromonospora sp. NBC_01813]|uniref:hypothetical protein n=1 Tax=Micromonospora sp. NBC_01813 TaxID=2975988 RepID=UPI002DD7DBF9|nr:hypothetical protein [Micromonospora sp. NBC_01813]WSA09074.1 hypothetical protein OG958_33860 [Micromonospora sp. NBC_01813]
MLVDIDSDYWDLPVLREAIAAQVWGVAREDSPYRREPLFPELEPAGRTGSVPAAWTGAVPAARAGEGRHRRPTPVG